jgi:hypothetical protein
MKKLYFKLLLLFSLFFHISFAATYPVPYNIVYHRISITINPGSSGAISNGSVTTWFKTTAANVTSIGFDLNQSMTVSSITYHGTALLAANLSHSSNVLLMTLPNIATVGTLDSVTIYYSGTPVSPTTTIPSGYNYSSSKQAIYTLGESFTGSTWWPCHDSLTDKIDSVDLIVTTPSAYRAGGNGLVTETISGSNRICTWKTRYPIATYMINFAAGNYVNYQYSINTGGTNLPVMNYLYSTDDNTTYENDVNVIQTILPAYVTLLNTNYPFLTEKYGIADCYGSWGALEVQSMTFCSSGTFDESTLAHELSHQWFGDKVTTNNWHEIWLNEGFAEFFQYVIYPELLQSASAAASSRSNLKSEVTTTSTVYVPNISNVDNIFIPSSSLAQPYEKGAMTLSMLRAWLGATNFYNALYYYVNAPGLAYNFTSVDSLEYYMQAQTPNSLTNFFNEWVNNEGRATYAVKYQYVTNGVYIQLTQSRTASPDPGYFDMPVPLEIKNSSGLDTTIVVIDRAGKLYNSQTGNTYGTSTIYYKLSATPTIAPVFDPNTYVLATASSIASSTTLSGLITLPVQQINLTAAANSNGSVNVNWDVQANEQLQSTSLERSYDGTVFTDIYTQNDFTDLPGNFYGSYNDDPTGSTIYYRLRIVKQDGENEYSNVKTLSISSGNDFEISPNPTRSNVNIKIPAEFNDGSVVVTVYDQNGQLVRQKPITGQYTNTALFCGDLSTGMYHLVLVNGKNEKLVKDFIKE